MKINFEEHYGETTYYNGTVDEEYPFIVLTSYRSDERIFKIKNIIWNKKKPKYKNKAEKRIKDVVVEWHYSVQGHRSVEDELDEITYANKTSINNE